jgi:hypothetical protein
MARTYRKTDQATAKLRKALGVLSHPEVLHGSSPYRAIGSVAVLVELALGDLDGETNFEDSPEFAAGRATVAGWDQPALFDADEMR